MPEESVYRMPTPPPQDTGPAVAAGPVVTCFQQPCPVCGRACLIDVQYLGSDVYCNHCRSAFLARDVSQDLDDETAGNMNLRRAERLLAMAEWLEQQRRVFPLRTIKPICPE